MALFDRLFRRDRERLPSLPEEARILDVDKLSVRTASELVILTVDVAGAETLIDAARDHAALQLRGPGRRRPVTVVPVKREEKIVLDPEHGWIIPLTAEQAKQVAALDASPSENELGDWAIVIE